MMQTPNKTDLQVIVKRTFKECLLRGVDDPVAFAQDFLDVEVHSGQAAWLRNRNDAKERMLHSGNRFGKTAVAGIKLLHRAFYQIRDPKYTFDAAGRMRPYICINVAMSLDQARLSWDYALQYAANSPRFSRFVVKSDFSPFPVMWIENSGQGKDKLQSEIWARSTAKRAKYLLGKNFAFINYDEAAFDADGEIVWNDVLRMRLADVAGDIDFTSTTNLKNWFYAQCEKGRLKGDGLDVMLPESYVNPRCYTQKGTTFENPHVDHEFIRETMQYMTDVQRLQNVYGEFADAASVFAVQYIEACYRDQDYAHLMGESGITPNHEVYYDEVDQGRVAKMRRLKSPAQYVIGADLARKRDNTAIIVLRVDCEPAELVHFKMYSRTGWTQVKEDIQRTHQKYNKAPILVDSTGTGDSVLSSLVEDYKLPATGYNFAGSGAEKMNLILHLQEAIQNRRIVFPFVRQLYDQLIYYDWQDKKLETDAVMGLALAWECALRSNMRTIWDPGTYALVVGTGSTNHLTGQRSLDLPQSERQQISEDERKALLEAAMRNARRRYDEDDDFNPADYGQMPVGGLF